MANYSSLKNIRYDQGSVLIPVLLFASLVALVTVILLQTQVVQKKAISEFKTYLKNKKNKQKTLRHYQSLLVENLFQIKNLKLVQSLPSDLHAYNTTDYHYYFQINSEQNYLYKVNLPSRNVVNLLEDIAFEYNDSKLNITQNIENNIFVLYIYDVKNNLLLAKEKFDQQPYLQLVGNPVDSIYIQDGSSLYKIELAFFPVLELKLLKKLEEYEEVLKQSPIVTRDARGDGRMIKIATAGYSIVYHEPSEVKSACLDLFEHEDFS